MSAPPPLYWIADLDAARDYGVDLPTVARAFTAAGGRLLSLRSGAKPAPRSRTQGATLSRICAESGATLLLHRHLELALQLGAQGLHLPSTSTADDVRQARRRLGDGALLFRSCHHRQDIELAARAGCDAVTLSPFFESLSKPGHRPQHSPDELHALCRASPLPVYALGGITADNGRQALDRGAHGLATIGAITDADDVAHITARFLALFGDRRRG